MTGFACAATPYESRSFHRDRPMGPATAAFEKKTYTSENGRVSFDYYLLPPAVSEPGRAYPLVLFLHGRSGHAYGAAVLAQQEMRDQYPAFILVPVLGENVSGWDGLAYALADPFKPRPTSHVKDLVDRVMREKPVDPDRVSVSGYSMGGHGTFAIIRRYPGFFAAGVPVCGYWPAGDAKNYPDTPLWVFHGSADSVVDPAGSRDFVNAMIKARKYPRYTEFPGTGHNSWEPAYSDPQLWIWLFRQRRSAD